MNGFEALILAIVFYRGRHSANIIILAQQLHFYEGTFNEFLIKSAKSPTSQYSEKLS